MPRLARLAALAAPLLLACGTPKTTSTKPPTGTPTAGGGGTTTAPTSGPTAPRGGPEIVEIVAGARHVCGRRGSGAVVCWGDNSRGQLGSAGVRESGAPRRRRPRRGDRPGRRRGPPAPSPSTATSAAGAPTRSVSSATAAAGRGR
ncbi:MAG: RCC1 domain-containing protein [Nannocystaceae bacterium]